MGSSSSFCPRARARRVARLPRNVAGERPSVRASSIAPVWAATESGVTAMDAERRAYASVKPCTSSLHAGARARALERREQRERQEEREVEDRVPIVRNLGVQHPCAVAAEQDVLRCVVAVDEAHARIAQLLDQRLQCRSEVGEPLHHDSVIRIEPQLGEGLVVAERPEQPRHRRP